MEHRFAKRTAHVHRSFIREILHYAAGAVEEGMPRLPAAVRRLLPSKFYAGDEINPSSAI